MQYGASRGVTELRELITKRVKEREGIDSKVENVMVTTGSEQVLDLVGKAFIDEGDEVLVEDQPTFVRWMSTVPMAPSLSPFLKMTRGCVSMPWKKR